MRVREGKRSIRAQVSVTYQHILHGSHRDWKSGKTWKNGKAFSSQGILSRLEKSGNFTQNTVKIGKKLYWKI